MPQGIVERHGEKSTNHKSREADAPLPSCGGAHAGK